MPSLSSARAVFCSIIALSVITAPALADQAAPPAADVDQLRAQLEALRAEYAQRLAELDARLSALGETPSETPAPVPSPSPSPEALAPGAPATPGPPPPQTAELTVPSGAAGAGGPAGALPVYGGATATSKVFNPDIGAIGDFIGAIGKSPGGGEPSLEMHEAELSFQAVVDPYARGDFFLTFGPEEVGIEEAYITFPAAPGGFLLKVGKMRDAFGKVDAQHNHVLPTTDRPLVSKNLLGGEDALADSGISLSHLVPNPWIFLEATGQVYRGDSEVFQAPTRGDLAYVGHLRAYQDLSDSTNLDLGGSVAYGHNGQTPTSTTRLLGADLTFRYRPLRRAIYTHVLARSEVVWSRVDGPGPAVNAFGTYAYLEYQFARRWFAGARFDYSGRADEAGVVDKGASAILTFWPSEFSQLRTQYRYTHFGEGRTANEVLFQFLFTIGAHGAHAF
jgi:hypothetical protein